MIKDKGPEIEDPVSHLWVKDIKADDQVGGLYLVKTKRAGLTKKGDPFLSITLADRTGEVECRVWENAEALSSTFQEGDILDVRGYASTYRNQVQLTLTDLRIPEEKGDAALFLETAPRDAAEMMGELRDLLKKGVKNPHLQAVLGRFLADRHFVALFKRSPAAKSFHHSYIGGLLEHTLSVCEMSQAVARHYPELDGELLMAGAFLHDLGKVRELTYDLRFDYTDEGRLLGHMILGITMLEEKLSALKDFPRDLALRLKHLMLSHHGEFEFGAPKRPKFLEAFALHLIDDLDAKMNGLGRFMAKDQQEGAWTEFNRLFERYFLKDRLPHREDRREADQPGDERQRLLFEVP